MVAWSKLAEGGVEALQGLGVGVHAVSLNVGACYPQRGGCSAAWATLPVFVWMTFRELAGVQAGVFAIGVATARMPRPGLLAHSTRSPSNGGWRW